MYPVYTLSDVLQCLAECSTLFPKTTNEWINIVRVVDKFNSWNLRKKASSKILPILDTIRSTKLALPEWRKAYRLFHTMADWFVLAHNDPPVSQYDETKVQTMIDHFARPETKKLPMILTMTTCKRLDLLTRTINSMLENCLDLQEYIREWVVMDDNSSDEDRATMKRLYPFINFIFKKPTDKGHPRSMNLLQKYVLNTSCKYQFHMEDDFEWWFPDRYLTKLLKVITLNPQFGQAVINFEYTEDAHQGRDVWNRDMYYTEVEHKVEGTKVDTKDTKVDTKLVRYFVHEYYTGERLKIENNHLGALSSMYWPHFTFRPGITNLQVYRKLGAFDENAKHFEMDYANKYVDKGGFKTAMLDCCYTTHIGRRTYERQSNKLNAYDLNSEQQFGQQPKGAAEATSPATTAPTQASTASTSVSVDANLMHRIRTFVINLRRRPERLVDFVKRNNTECPSFEVFDGVDGRALEPCLKVHKIFETGDYNYRRGIVGCAYSHLKIWHSFLQGKSEFCLVLEDDVQLTVNFREKLLYLLEHNKQQFDLMFLHWNPYPHVPNQHLLTLQYSKPTAELWSMQRSVRDNMGSGAAYLMTRHAAQHMIEWVNKHGMPNAVDWNLFKQPDLRVMYTTPMLAFGQCWQNNTKVDSDIQKEYDVVKFNTEADLVQHEIKRWLREVQPKNTKYGVVCYNNVKPSWLSLPSYAESAVCVMDEAETYENLPWSDKQQRLFLVPATTKVDRSLPVKWYTLGSVKMVVPDLLISKKMYEDTVWFDNRVNFSCI
jgi:GR25 family glycosyltransferase involved in LPS biosynthesis